MRAPRFLSGIVALFASHTALGVVATPFSLATHDRTTKVTGEIDLPDSARDCPECRFPLVIMVPGTGLHDRDYMFGISGTDADFLFKDMALKLAEAGIASLRYDYRGISCNPRTAPPCPECTTPQLRNQHYISSCIDNNVRASVTMDNMDADVALIYEHGLAQQAVDPSRIIFLAHSEGTVHVSRLIAAQKVAPKGLVFLGMVAESPAGVMHWQQVERFLRVFNWDANRDGNLTNEEIHAGFVADPYFSSLGLTVDYFLSPSGAWTERTLQDSREREYHRMRDELLSHADDEPLVILSEPYMVQASYAWSKSFYTDDRPIVDLLKSYAGPLIAHIGGNDSQTPGERELGILSAFAGNFAVPPRGYLHPGVGHGFSPDNPLLGPITSFVKDAIIEDVKALVK